MTFQYMKHVQPTKQLLNVLRTRVSHCGHLAARRALKMGFPKKGSLFSRVTEQLRNSLPLSPHGERHGVRAAKGLFPKRRVLEQGFWTSKWGRIHRGSGSWILWPTLAPKKTPKHSTLWYSDPQARVCNKYIHVNGYI